MYYVYILQSLINKKHYYGYTSDLLKRIDEHNNGLSTYTKMYMPWKLIYYEEFQSRSEAMKREKYFKSLNGYKWLKDKGII